MKKYFLAFSLLINVILIIGISVFAVKFYNLKNTLTHSIDQVKNGQYSQLVKENTAALLPDSLKNVNPLEVGKNQCEYFYQHIDSLIGYLDQNAEISGANIYAGQLNALKSTVEKTPSTLKEMVCKKGISTISYIAEKLKQVEEK